MPRRLRYIVPNLPHHLIQRGNNRQDVFRDAQDRTVFLRHLVRSSLPARVRIGSYCLMTNHVHLIVYPETIAGHVRMVKQLFQSYTRYFNRKYDRSGKLWENRYKMHIVDPEKVWVVARYIEMNPVRAHLVQDAEDYPYSSARRHISGQRDDVITIDIIRGELDSYRQFFREHFAHDPAHVGTIRTLAKQEKALGSREFIEYLETRFGVGFELRAPGRPSLSPNL